MSTNSDQAAVKSALDKLLSCRKFGAESIVDENYRTFAGIMSNNSKSMALTGGGFAFVHSPGIACILPQNSGGPVREAVHVLESFVLRREPGGIKAEGIVKDIPDNPNKQVGDFRRNFGYAIILTDIRELYVQFRFKDGSSSREVRTKVPENKSIDPWDGVTRPSLGADG